MRAEITCHGCAEHAVSDSIAFLGAALPLQQGGIQDQPAISQPPQNSFQQILYVHSLRHDSLQSPSEVHDSPPSPYIHISPSFRKLGSERPAVQHSGLEPSWRARRVVDDRRGAVPKNAQPAAGPHQEMGSYSRQNRPVSRVVPSAVQCVLTIPLSDFPLMANSIRSVSGLPYINAAG